MQQPCKGTCRDGSRCANPPMRGQVVCRMHGGAAPQAKAAGQRRNLEAKVGKVLARLDVAQVDDPLTELSKVAGQVLAWRDACAQLVNGLQAQVGKAEGGEDGLRYSAAGAGTEQLRAEVELFERALDRCVSTLGLIAKLNIDERLAKLSERQVDAVVRAIDAAIDELGATGTAAAAARTAAARELRVVK